MNNNKLVLEANRRQFLKMGAGGAALLGGLATLSQLSGCSSRKAGAAVGYRHLRDQDLELLIPLALTGMGGAITEDEQTLMMQRLDAVLDSGTPGGRDFIFLLYDALQLAPFRWFVCGAGKHPRDMTDPQLAAALHHWGTHSNNFARIALRGLLQPIQISWYSYSDAAQRIGYPGPPKKVVA